MLKWLRKYLCSHGWFCKIKGKEVNKVISAVNTIDHGRIRKSRCYGCGREWWHF